MSWLVSIEKSIKKLDDACYSVLPHSKIKKPKASQKKSNNLTKTRSSKVETLLDRFDNLFAFVFEEQPAALMDPAVAKEMQKNEQDIKLSLISLVMSTAGAMFYPPLGIISAIPMLYLVFPIMKQGCEAVFKRHTLKDDSVIEGIVWVGALGLGLYVIGATVLCLRYFSYKLILHNKDKGQKKLFAILEEKPSTVWILAGETEINIPFEQLQKDDILVVSAGETIAVDGIVARGMALVDQHILTGESQPIEKEAGDTVLASTIVLSGRIYVQVREMGKGVIAEQISKVLHQTVGFKSTQQSRGENIANQSVVPTLIAGVAVAPFLGIPSMLMVFTSCFGYHMKVYGPLNSLAFLSNTSNIGILIKDGRSLEMLHKIDTVIFDKTGTLTIEQPYINKIHSCRQYSEKEILIYAATAEQKQSHPIAKTIIDEAKARCLNLLNIDDASYEIGYGIKVKIDDKSIYVGSIRFMEMNNVEISKDIKRISIDYSLVMVAINQELIGYIELATTIRSEAHKVINFLQQRNITTYILSGDQEEPTQKLARQLGVDGYFAEALPQDKAKIVEELQNKGKNVCFIGDGINDTIALKKANVSISLNGATTIAQDTAQIVFTNPNLEKLCVLLQLSENFEERMQKSFLISVVPGFVTLGSLFLFHAGLLTAAVINVSSLLIGVAYTTSPVELESTVTNEMETSK